MRHRAGDQVWAVGAVDADVAAARPVGQRRRSRARAERDRPVERALVARQPVADDELAARRGRVRCADADGDAEDGATVAQERRAPARRGRRRGACAPSRRRRARSAAPSRVVPLGSAGSRTRTQSSPRWSRRRASGRTMVVVASGVRAARMPTAGAEPAGRRRAVTSRRTAAHVVSPGWRSSATGGPIANAAARSAGSREAAAVPAGFRARGSGEPESSAAASRIAGGGQEGDRGERRVARTRASPREARLAPAAGLHHEASVGDDRERAALRARLVELVRRRA